MAANALPLSAFDSLFQKLASVLEATQSTEPLTPQAKQALFQVTTDFKTSLANAKALVQSLPGGELLIEEQNAVIGMLEDLRDMKRQQLAQFSEQALQTLGGPSAASVKMEIDSNASSPHA